MPHLRKSTHKGSELGTCVFSRCLSPSESLQNHVLKVLNELPSDHVSQSEKREGMLKWYTCCYQAVTVCRLLKSQSVGCLGHRVWVVKVTGCGLFRTQDVGCLGHSVWVV